MNENKLNNKQKKFVENYLKTFNATKSAKNAGYSEKTAAEQGYRLLRNVQIAEAINEELGEIYEKQKKVLIRAADSAINALIDTVENGKGLARVQAANSVLDRAGHKPIDKVQADVKTEAVDPDEIRNKLMERIIKQMPEESDTAGNSET